MAGHRKYDELRARMSPQRRRRNDSAIQEELRLMLLEELRRAESLSQAELARRMGVSQPAVARLPSGEYRIIQTA